LSGQAEIEPRVAAIRRVSKGEERVAPVRARRRENIDLATIEESPNLALGQAHCRGRGDDLGPHFLAIRDAAAKLIQGRLLEPHHGAHRPGYQMQLVLDDQIGRLQRSR
jgi:hypothetical protein